MFFVMVVNLGEKKYNEERGCLEIAYSGRLGLYMEHAIWKKEELTAFEVAEDYFYEKKIREASYRGELRCPDPECRNPILKYCHGEIREPYFAHRDMTECDYLEYEKSSGMFREIRRKLYEHFAGLDYPVAIEVKVLAHHYTPLLFIWEDGRKTALELGTKSTNVREIEALRREYKEKGFEVAWLVVDEPARSVAEDHTYFMKRFCLHEASGNSLIVLGYDGNRVTQYKEDPNRYFENERELVFYEYPHMFVKEAHRSELCFEEGRLTTRGFEEQFAAYVESRRRHALGIFEEKMQEEDEEEERRAAERRAYFQRMEELRRKR